jgi:hypothetical protein
MVKLSPLVQNEVKRLQSRIQVAHRRIEKDKNADEEAEVIDRLSPLVEKMQESNSLQEFVQRPILQKKSKPAPKAKKAEEKPEKVKTAKGETPKRSKGPAQD